VKSPKRIAIIIGAGFLAFAPPGTLIFAAVLIIGFVGNAWLVAGGAVGLVVIGVSLLVWRRQAAKGPPPG